MDEQPGQLLQDTRAPIAATHTHPQRVDYAYARAGTASLFLCAEALAGWRQVSVREHRTTGEWAIEVEERLRTRSRQAERGILVCDNLTTHTPGAFYAAFAPAAARAIGRRFEMRYTPTHGRGLTIAENARSALTRQCVKGRRLGALERLREEATAWEA
jgi:hypothetical protein